LLSECIVERVEALLVHVLHNVSRRCGYQTHFLFPLLFKLALVLDVRLEIQRLADSQAVAGCRASHRVLCTAELHPLPEILAHGQRTVLVPALVIGRRPSCKIVRRCRPDGAPVALLGGCFSLLISVWRDRCQKGVLQLLRWQVFDPLVRVLVGFGLPANLSCFQSRVESRAELDNVKIMQQEV
jgi:hypothetical protein